MSPAVRAYLHREVDRRVRLLQPAYDELDAALAALDDGRVFDVEARDTMTGALLGLSIGAEHALERSAA